MDKSYEIKERAGTTLDRVRSPFPQEFNFYDLGIVKRVGKLPQAPELYKMIILFDLVGDDQGHCIVGFEEEPIDPFMAMEMANILCAKITLTHSEVSGNQTYIGTPTIVTALNQGYENHLNHQNTATVSAYQYISDESPYMNLRVALVVKSTGKA